MLKKREITGKFEALKEKRPESKNVLKFLSQKTSPNLFFPGVILGVIAKQIAIENVHATNTRKKAIMLCLRFLSFNFLLYSN